MSKLKNYNCHLSHQNVVDHPYYVDETNALYFLKFTEFSGLKYSRANYFPFLIENEEFGANNRIHPRFVAEACSLTYPCAKGCANQKEVKTPFDDNSIIIKDLLALYENKWQCTNKKQFSNLTVISNYKEVLDEINFESFLIYTLLKFSSLDSGQTVKDIDQIINKLYFKDEPLNGNEIKGVTITKKDKETYQIQPQNKDSKLNWTLLTNIEENEINLTIEKESGEIKIKFFLGEDNFERLSFSTSHNVK